jgi:MFS family permease
MSMGSTSPSRNDSILFWASFLTLIAAGIGFSVRGTSVLAAWGTEFGFTQTELGTITGGGLAGFGITIIVLSFVADRIGYGRLMLLAFLLHASSAIVTLAAGPVFQQFGKEGAFKCLNIGMWLFSLGNGTCEAVINPLTATLFPNRKTHWLNILHAGWPAGLILGSVIGLIFKEVGPVSWQVQISIFLVPTLLYGILMFGKTFPQSEAAKSGVKVSEMMGTVGLFGFAVVSFFVGLFLSETIAPAFGLEKSIGWIAAGGIGLALFFYSGLSLGSMILAILYILHGLVGYVELGTDSWISNITGKILESPQLATILFIYTSSLMTALRFFAGPIVEKISPLGLLFVSALLGASGLVLLSKADGTVMCFLAATIYGLGKTFLWPTMLGVVSEQYPKGGALALGISGGIGMLSAGFLGGPGIGFKQDFYATEKIQEISKPAYDRYKVENERDFYGLTAKIAGLDNSKVSTLKDEGEKLQGDLSTLAKTGGKDENLNKLDSWWQAQGKPNLNDDKPKVLEAELFGARMALLLTAIVPALMAIGYLLLIFVFNLKGGYKQEHIS